MQEWAAQEGLSFVTYGEAVDKKITFTFQAN